MVNGYQFPFNRGGRHRTPPSRTCAYVKHLVENNEMEEFETELRHRLHEFCSSPDQELEIEPLPRLQRKLLHAVASEFELRTQTIGDGPNRRVLVVKTRFNRMISLTDTQRILLSNEQLGAMLDYLEEDPVQYSELEDQIQADPWGRGQFRSGVQLSRTYPVVPPRSQTTSDMHRVQQRLPTTRFKDEILEKIKENAVTIITGGTGCGKTTQVPQFLLDRAHEQRQAVRIVCTQPRRLPAIAVSERVARERGEPIGDTVGYHIRLEQKVSNNTALIYCTSGILLRMLTLDDSARDITHIVLDEVHEREQNTDYLLIVLREALKKRSDLKVILMSATMEGNREMFLRYFREYSIGTVEIPSRLHSVEKFFLGDVLAMTGYTPHSAFGGTFDESQSGNDFPSIEHFHDQSAAYPSNYADQSLHTTQTVPDLQRYQQQHYAQPPAWPPSQYASPYPPSNMLPYAPTQPSMPMDQLGAYPAIQRSTTVPANLQGMQNGYQMPANHWDPNGMSMMPPQPYADNQMYNQQYMNNYQYGSGNGWQHPSYYAQPNEPPRGPPPASTPQRSQAPGPAASGTPERPQRVFGSRPTRPPQEDMRTLLGQMLPERPETFTPEFLPILKRAKVDEKRLIAAYLRRGGQQWTDSVDPKLVTAVIAYCLDSPVQGAILAFLPGYDDIMSVRDLVQQLKSNQRPLIFTLHSQMNSQDQARVFDPAPHGCRKIILSTNIAEASLTIDGVVFVIDSGKVKEKGYDHNTRISELKTISIAQSNAEQRSGRAGRTSNGYCFRLYTRDEFNEMNVTQVAEMKRVAIHEICLHAKMFAPEKMSVRRLLERAPEPPDAAAVELSLKFLEEIGALYTMERPFGNQAADCEITDLGRIIAHLPLEPQLARLLLFGVALKVFYPVVSLVAALSHREPFVLPLGEDRQTAGAARDHFSRMDYSDHLMLIRALNEYSACNPASRLVQFCRQHFLSPQAMKMIVGVRRQLFGELKRLHLIPYNVHSIEDAELNQFSHSWPMVQGAIVAGCYPGMGIVRSGTKLRKIHTNAGKAAGGNNAANNANLHPSSSLRRQVQTNYRPESLNRFAREEEPNIEYLAYQELSKIDDQLTLRVVTAVPPMAALFFAGPIRMSKVVANEFEVAEEGYEEDLPRPDKIEVSEEAEAPDFGDSTDLTPARYKREYYVETSEGLAFRGHFRPLQAALRLRLKLMCYFLNFLKQPQTPLSPRDLNLLQTIGRVLEMDHRRVGFSPVTDLYTQRQVPAKYGSNQTKPAVDQRRRPPDFGDSPPADPKPTDPPPANVEQPAAFRPPPNSRDVRPPPRRPQPPPASKQNSILAQMERAQNGAKHKEREEPKPQREEQKPQRSEQRANEPTERATDFFRNVGIDWKSTSKPDERNGGPRQTVAANLRAREQRDRRPDSGGDDRRLPYGERAGRELYVPPGKRSGDRPRAEGNSNGESSRQPFHRNSNFRGSGRPFGNFGAAHESNSREPSGREPSNREPNARDTNYREAEPPRHHKFGNTGGHRMREIRNSNRHHPPPSH